MPARKSYSGGTGRCTPGPPAAQRLDDAQRRRASHRACRHRGSRGRRPAPAARRAGARRRVRHRLEQGREIDVTGGLGRSTCSLPVCRLARRRRLRPGGGDGRRIGGGPRPGRRRDGQPRRPASAGSPRRQVVRRRHRPPARRAAGARGCRARRCRRAATWSSGMRLMRSVLPSSCRTNGMARPSAAMVAVASRPAGR